MKNILISQNKNPHHFLNFVVTFNCSVTFRSSPVLQEFLVGSKKEGSAIEKGEPVEVSQGPQKAWSRMNLRDSTLFQRSPLYDLIHEAPFLIPILPRQGWEFKQAGIYYCVLDLSGPTSVGGWQLFL